MFLILSLKNVKWYILLCVFSRPTLYARFTACPATKREQIYLGTYFPAAAEEVFTASSSCRVISALRQKQWFYPAWSGTLCFVLCLCVCVCMLMRTFEKKKWRKNICLLVEVVVLLKLFFAFKNVLKSFRSFHFLLYDIPSERWHIDHQCPVKTL